MTLSVPFAIECHYIFIMDSHTPILILDGYVDEPTCLGVPPFISPYVRNLYGMLKQSGYHQIDYLTIDSVRNQLNVLQRFSFIIIVCGCAVPGKYLGGKPIYRKELQIISENLSGNQTVLLTGPVQYLSYFKDFSRMIPLSGYPSLAVSKYLTDEKKRIFPDENWVLAGAELVTLHPNYPDIIAEITTFSGCLRERHCSFCIEGNKAEYHRKPEAIIQEMAALNSAGIQRFRLGNQSDLLMYNAGKSADHSRTIHLPSIHKLMDGIKNKIQYKILHIDNVNPLSIVRQEKEAAEALAKIAEVCSEYNCAPLGLESADPMVIEKNHLKCSADEVYRAIEMVNENGCGKLLPGLNFVFGLTGETKKTYQINYDFLSKVLNSNNLLRRINLRKVFIHPFSDIADAKNKPINSYLFDTFKEKVNQDIDIPMMKKVFPLGSILKDVKVETYVFPFSYARQVASYPITAQIPLPLDIGKFLDVFVVAHHSRSLVCLPVGIPFQNLKEDMLMKITGISRKMAADIILSGKNLNKDFIPDYIKPHIKF